MYSMKIQVNGGAQGDILKVRVATEREMAWVNSCYDEVEFIHSQFDNEIIAIAEFGEKKRGWADL